MSYKVWEQFNLYLDKFKFGMGTFNMSNLYYILESLDKLTNI